MDCIFCKIIQGEIKSDILYEDEKMIVINDVNPKAKKHYLLIPKKHYPYLEDANEQEKQNLSDYLSKIPELKEKLGIEDGYRIIINQGENGGQEVNHLHIHILGGEKLSGL